MSTTEERISVASNWRLVWWRFRRHRLAVVSALVLAVLYAIVLAPDFVSTHDPEATEARQAFIPIQRLHLFDGWRLAPWVPAVAGKRNPTTLRMEWRIDESRKIPVRFFVAGHPYRLLGIVPPSHTDPHQDEIGAGARQSLDIFLRLNAALGDEPDPRRDPAHDLLGSAEIHFERVQVPCVDAKHLWLSRKRRLELAGGVHFDQRRHAPLPDRGGQLLQLPSLQYSRDQQHGARTGNSRFENLSRMNDEILSQHGHANGRRHLSQVFDRPSKVALLGQN